MPLKEYAYLPSQQYNISFKTQILPPSKIYNETQSYQYLRLNGHWTVSLGTGRWVLDCGHFRMNVAIQFVVQIEITLVFQRCATSGTLETFDMEILVLYANKHTTEMEQINVRWLHKTIT